MTSSMPLKKHHTMQLQATAAHVVECEALSDLHTLIASGDLFKAPSYLILGDGSNVVFLNDFPGMIVLNRLQGCDLIKETEEYVWLEVAAGEVWHDVVMRCNEWGYSGIENLALIPGRVGAAPIQNIGAYGAELSDVCEEVSLINVRTGNASVLSRDECEFSYRSSVFQKEQWQQYCITSVTLRLRRKNHCWRLDYAPLKEALAACAADNITGSAISEAVILIRKARLPDPAVLANAGSFFKNPIVSQDAFLSLQKKHPSMPHYSADDQIKIPAAWLIEACGLKGYRDGDVGTYAQHALVMVNHGDATGEQLWQCVQHIRQAVYQRFSVLLNPEVGCYRDGKRIAPSCGLDQDLA